jgi:hypothetical protein
LWLIAASAEENASDLEGDSGQFGEEEISDDDQEINTGSSSANTGSTSTTTSSKYRSRSL